MVQVSNQSLLLLRSALFLGKTITSFKVQFFTSVPGQGTSTAADTIIASAVSDVFKQVCIAGTLSLLEPVMKVSITADVDVMPQIIQDLLVQRRGQLETDWMEGSGEGSQADAVVLAPMAELKGYANHVRSSSSGRAFFGMEFSHYAAMSDAAQQSVLADMG